jgi:hypothetical protein
MRVLLLALLLTGCMTTLKVTETSPVDTTETDKLKNSITRLSYLIDNDMCFTQYAVCLGEKKRERDACFKTHEQCVVNVYNTWKELLNK